MSAYRLHKIESRESPCSVRATSACGRIIPLPDIYMTEEWGFVTCLDCLRKKGE